MIRSGPCVHKRGCAGHFALAVKVCLAASRAALRSRAMNDPRYDLLAKNLVSFSVSLKRGERVLCDMFDVPDEMTVALVRAVRAVGAVPFVQIHHGRVSREMAMGAVEEGLEVTAGVQLAQMKKCTPISRSAAVRMRRKAPMSRRSR